LRCHLRGIKQRKSVRFLISFVTCLIELILNGFKENQICFSSIDCIETETVVLGLIANAVNSHRDF